MGGDRVEFVDRPEGLPGGTDELDVGAPPPRRRTVLLVLAVVGVLLVAGLVARLQTGGGVVPATPSTSPSAVARRTLPGATGPPVFGLIGLPRAIGEPGALVAAASGDVVWMVDHGAGVVRIEGGRVTRVQLLEAQATAVAVSPDGSRLYVATTGDTPAVQELDGETLALGRSRTTERTVQALAVSSDAVWAATAGSLLRLDRGALTTFATVPLPDVLVTGSLAVGSEPTGADEVVTGLATEAGGVGDATTRPFRVDPLTDAVRFGPAHEGEVQTAASSFERWLAWRDPDTDTLVTTASASVVDTVVLHRATPPLASSSRIFDPGPAGSGFLVVADGSSVIGCRDDAGFRTSEVDLAPALPGAQITGAVLRTDTAFYAATDRGLVRAGPGACA